MFWPSYWGTLIEPEHLEQLSSMDSSGQDLAYPREPSLFSMHIVTNSISQSALHEKMPVLLGNAP